MNLILCLIFWCTVSLVPPSQFRGMCKASLHNSPNVGDVIFRCLLRAFPSSFFQLLRIHHRFAADKLLFLTQASSTIPINREHHRSRSLSFLPSNYSVCVSVCVSLSLSFISLSLSLSLYLYLSLQFSILQYMSLFFHSLLVEQ